MVKVCILFLSNRTNILRTMSQYKCSLDPKTNISSGRKRLALFNTELSLGEICLRLIDRNPNQVVQINADSGIAYTNLDIKQRAIRSAQFLQQQGLQLGDVVGVIARNSANLAPILLASFITGMPFNGLDPFFMKSDIVHIFGITQPKIVFCDQINYETVQSALDELNLDSKICIVDGRVPGVPHVTDFMENADESWLDFECPVLASPGKIPAVIMCSSGTTGKPKAVVLSQATLILCAQEAGTNCDDVYLNFSTVYWFTGVWTLMIGFLNGTTKIMTTEKATSTLILNLIEKYKVTHFSSPPSYMAMLLQDPSIRAEQFDSVRKYMCGGSQVPKSLLTKMNCYLKNGKVYEMYGMTELGNIATEDKIIVDNLAVKIVDEKRKCLGIGNEGEILMHSPHPFLGYLKNPEQTATTLLEDGWVYTGDIGYLDENGQLFLVDRKKDVLKNCGYQYSPAEIDDVILEMSGVAEACVCGVTDTESSDLPTALVVRAKGSRISEQDIVNYTSTRLSHYKHLRGGVFFADSIPMTASGKYQRNKVKEICTELYNRRQVIGSRNKTVRSY